MNPSSSPDTARRRRGRPDVLDLLTRARPDSLDADPMADIPAADFMASSTAPVPPTQAPAATRRPGARRVRLVATGLAVTAAAAAVALGVTSTLTGPGPGGLHAAGPSGVGRSGVGSSGVGSSGPAASRSRPVVLSARALLLTAADHVVVAPVTGRYWRVREEQIQVDGAGTRAHPYDMTVPTITDMWLSPVAGDRDYYYSEQLAARPASPADAAAWRAAGSPRFWRSFGRLAFATRPMYREQTWQYGQGKIGYLEGNLAFLSLAQFRALPATPHGLARALRREAMQTWSAQHPGAGGATADQIIWDEALQVLQDPVSSRVRAAALRVMAGLPGVRMLGARRDPLGRPGYAFGTGRTALGEIAIIDPATGSLLASVLPGAPLSQIANPRLAQRKGSGRREVNLFGRPGFTGPAATTCVLITGWTNRPPRFARTARHFDALIGY